NHMRHTQLVRHGVGDRQQSREEAIVETRNAKHDGDVVKPREISAQDQGDLEQDCNSAGPVAERRRGEVKPWYDELSEVIEQYTDFVEPARRMMQIPAKRAWQRLSFIMIKKAGEIAPARVGAHLDHTRTEHSAEKQPKDQPHHDRRRPRVR